MKLTGRIAVILSLALLLLAGCSGSGGDNGTATPTPTNSQAQATQAGAAADNAIDAIEISAEGGGESLKASFAATKAFGAGKAFGRDRTRSLTSIMTEQFNGTNLRSKAAGLQQMAACSAGGSQEIINNINTATEFRFTVQYDQCTDPAVDNNGIEVETVLDGLYDLQALIMISGSSGSVKLNQIFEDFTSRTTIVSSGILREDIFTNFEVRYTVEINDFTTCGANITGLFSMTSNGTIRISQDTNADGDVNDSDDTDTSAIVTNYAANGTATLETDSNCNPGAFLEMDVATPGSVSFTDNINPRASFAISSPESDPLRINDRVEPGGRSYMIDGTLTTSVDEPCIDETSLTFTFLTTERIFVPESAKCPTAGQLMVMLNDTAITVTYTGSGGVEVSSGDTVETFDSCDDIDACRDSS